MKNRIFKKLVLVLVIILTVISCYIIIKINNNKVKAQSYKRDKAVQISTNNKIEDWNQKLEVLKDELHKQNQLIVLEGKRTIRCEYNNSNDFISDQNDKSNKLRWLYQKLAELKTKSIYVQTQYDYSFILDLNRINIYNDKEGVSIKLNRSNIILKPIAENSNERIIKDDVGILSKKFTPQEISALLSVTQINTYNNIVNDNELYKKSLNNAKEDIEKLVKGLNLENINVEIMDSSETIQDDRLTILDDNNN